VTTFSISNNVPRPTGDHKDQQENAKRQAANQAHSEIQLAAAALNLSQPQRKSPTLRCGQQTLFVASLHCGSFFLPSLQTEKQRRKVMLDKKKINK
jgi:hypothetical protein